MPAEGWQVSGGLARLIAALQRMAAQQTNAVLEVLGDQSGSFQEEKKYPQPALAFGQGPWRAFYHRHAVPDIRLAEHGHFHLFVAYQQQWLHVAALSMSSDGQPQAWLAVNRWVTDGPWLAAADLQEHLSTQAIPVAGLSLLEDWLLAMLQVCRDDIGALLETRDRTLHQNNNNKIDTMLLNNRDIYTLAVHEFDLLSKINSLNPEAQAGGSQ